MGEKIVGFHAIEEGLKGAQRGSVLYLERGVGARLQRIEYLAQANGKVIIRKAPKADLDRLSGGADHRGAVLDLVVGERAAQAKGTKVDVKTFVDRLGDDEPALVLDRKSVV